MVENKLVSSTHLHFYPFDDILSQWNVTFKKIHPEITVSGSPQRSEYRLVIEDDQKQKYVLEKIPKNKYAHKRLIAQSLSFLSDQKLPGIVSYLQNIQDEFITTVNNGFWQLQPYINGVKLDRPSYVFNEWRGDVLAEFLIQLWNVSTSMKEEFFFPFFSLKDYFIKMTNTMKQYNPKEYQNVKPVINYLASDFLDHYKEIPVKFCHGDYHPLNIIWGRNSIHAVIDWEFLGLKVEIYDVANLLGCIGIEEPTSLVNDFAIAFIKRVKESRIISEKSFHYLLDCMLTLRFAWLAEWFRTYDYDMMQLEIDFINLVNNNKMKIKEKWDSI